MGVILLQYNTFRRLGISGRLRLLAFGVSSLLAAQGAQAQILPANEANPGGQVTPQFSYNDLPAIAVNREVAIFGAGLLQDYFEYVKFPNSQSWVPDKENGWVPGFGVRASMMHDVGIVDDLYGRVEYEYDKGTTSYSGHYLLAPQIALHAPSNETIQDFRAELGKGIALDDKTVLIPVLQMEYRTWDRGLSYTEHYRYTAIGAGLRGDYAVTDQWVVTAKAGVEYMVDAEQQTDGVPAIGFYPTTFHLETNAIFIGTLGVDYQIYRALHAFGEMDYTYFDFGHSSVVNGYFEPDSHTSDLRLRLGLALKF